MGGLLALYAFDDLWNLSNHVYYGLTALDHRGSEKYVACTVSNGRVKCYKDSKERISKEVTTPLAIAATYSNEYSDIYLGSYSTNNLEFVMIGDRDSKIMDIIGEEVTSRLRSLNTSMTNEILLTFKEVLNELNGKDIPSFIAITNKGEILAYRSSTGLTPLTLGGYGFDLALISSESRAIDILGGDIRKWLRPNELLYLSKYAVKSIQIQGKDTGHLCAFELLYMARHDSIVDGINVYKFRKVLGHALAENLDADVDIVVGVPETAIPYAIGLAQAINKPFEIGFVSTGKHMRSALRVDPLQKLIAIHLKMNPVVHVLEGKKIALVDDSMVTGATMKTVSQILRYRVGVEELHVVIASPPLIRGCPYKLMPIDVKSLLAANLDTENAVKYLEVDSLTWIKPKVMSKVARIFNVKLCGKCFGIDFVG